MYLKYILFLVTLLTTITSHANERERIAKSFRDSIERAIYKASPLPAAPNESVFDRELFIDFRVN